MPDIPGFSVSAAAGFCTSARCERAGSEHRRQQRDARAHPPAPSSSGRRVRGGADSLVDRDQDRRADHAVPRHREAPAPVGLGEGVADAPCGGPVSQRARRDERQTPADRPTAPAAAPAERRGDRPALERERVAQAAEPAARVSSVTPSRRRRRAPATSRVVELVEQLASPAPATAPQAARRRRSRSLVAASAQAAITSPQGAPVGNTNVPRLPRVCTLGRQGATARMHLDLPAGADARQLVVVGDALAGARDQHERARPSARGFAHDASLEAGVPWRSGRSEPRSRAGAASAASSSSRAPTPARRRASRASPRPHRARPATSAASCPSAGRPCAPRPVLPASPRARRSGGRARRGSAQAPPRGASAARRASCGAHQAGVPLSHERLERGGVAIRDGAHRLAVHAIGADDAPDRGRRAARPRRAAARSPCPPSRARAGPRPSSRRRAPRPSGARATRSPARSCRARNSDGSQGAVPRRSSRSRPARASEAVREGRLRIRLERGDQRRGAVRQQLVVGIEQQHERSACFQESAIARGREALVGAVHDELQSASVVAPPEGRAARPPTRPSSSRRRRRPRAPRQLPQARSRLPQPRTPPGRSSGSPRSARVRADRPSPREVVADRRRPNALAHGACAPPPQPRLPPRRRTRGAPRRARVPGPELRTRTAVRDGCLCLTEAIASASGVTSRGAASRRPSADDAHAFPALVVGQQPAQRVGKSGARCDRNFLAGLQGSEVRLRSRDHDGSVHAPQARARTNPSPVPLPAAARRARRRS